MPYKNPEDDKACRLRNRHKKLAYMKRYRLANLDAEKARGKKWQLANADRIRAQRRQHAKDHPEVRARAVAKYQAKNRNNPEWKARMAANSRRWRAAHPERAKAVGRRYHARRVSEGDANYIIKTRLRARLQKKIRAKGLSKAGGTQELTGCTTDFLRGYLEARFLPGMTWANHGEWHIDHVIPCAEFDLRDPVQPRQCFNYSNLRPLWGADNVRKRATPPAPHQAELL